jgi:hypothetical protein
MFPWYLNSLACMSNCYIFVCSIPLLFIAICFVFAPEMNMPSVKLIPILATFGRLTLDYREYKCFIRGPETHMEMK